MGQRRIDGPFLRRSALPESSPPGPTLPLDGITAVSVEQYGAGPFGSLHLADMGARVIKIEPPGGTGGDSSRRAGPFFLGARDSHFFQTFNRSKESITLDLKSSDGQAILKRLAARADVVMNNLRGDQPERLGLTFAQLEACNARLVCAHLSGYGRSGERAAWPAYDYLAQAEAGFLALTGEPGGPPQRMGLSIVDYMTGVTTAFAVCAALLGAHRSGRGRDVDVSLYDVAMHLLTYPATWYLNESYEVPRRPRSGHPSVVPCETIPTKDGHVLVMCVLPKFWVRLCQGIGRPELADDPRFADFPARFENRAALMATLDAAFAAQTSGHWMARFAGEIPIAPVLGLGEALENPFFVARGGVQAVTHPERAELKMVASPIRLDGALPPARSGPSLGGQTDRVLSELGYGAKELAGLRAKGVI